MPESACSPSPTTSVVCFDKNDRLVEASGEFSQLEACSAEAPDKQILLGEYLSLFDTINRGTLGTDTKSAGMFIDRWAQSDGAAFEGQLKAGGWRMLTSYPDASGQTRFLSIRIDHNKQQETAVSFIMDNHPLPVWANETETGKVVFANPAANKLYNTGPLSQEKQKVVDFMGSADLSRKMLEELRQHGSFENYDVQTKNLAGKEIWVTGSARLTEFDGTEIVISSIQNITDRKKIEESSRRALDLLNDAIESLTEGFALYDQDHRLVLFNKRYKEMNGLVADLLEPGLPYEMMLREMARRGGYADAVGREDEWVAERLENAVVYAKGDEVNHTNGKSYEVSIHPTKLGGFVVIRNDVTERKQVEAQERDGDLLIRTMLDASSAVVIMARTGDGEILYRSPAALEMFGNTKSAREHYVDPDERADFVTQMLADGQVDDYQLYINARGERIPAAISARFAEYRGEEVIVTSVIDLSQQVKAQALIKEVLEASPVPLQMTKADTGETLFRSPETLALFGTSRAAKSYYVDPADRDRYLQELRDKGWARNRKMRYYNAGGDEFWGAASAQLIEFEGEEVIVSSTRDMTEELAIQEELEQQREMLFQNEKMSALGELLAGVAHELNNPLSVVVGHSLMLREEEHDPETHRRIDKISTAAERAAKIVKTFLAMARQQPAKIEQVDIHTIVATAIDVAGYGKSAEGLQILSALPEDLPEILADADQITQVIINLVINAVHAIGNSGTGDRITVAGTHTEGSGQVEIRVYDNGPGIPDNIRARIFEPFFTTKDVGDGTGIGLAFCHRIIHSHGGQIRLDPDHTGGSCFSILLPAATAERAEEKDETPDRSKNTSLRILIVDDESDIAELNAEILSKSGFEVGVVHSGAQAISRLNEEDYDILLSDLNMPEVDGRGLYEYLLESKPHMIERTGFITGDTMGRSSQTLLQESQRPYLEKPVSPRELRQLVDGILNDLKDDS